MGVAFPAAQKLRYAKEHPVLIDPSTGQNVEVPGLVAALYDWIRTPGVVRRLHLRPELVDAIRKHTTGAIRDRCQGINEYWLRSYLLLFLDKHWVRGWIAARHAARDSVPFRQSLHQLNDWRRQCREFVEAENRRAR
jgi:hypothetical protein